MKRDRSPVLRELIDVLDRFTVLSEGATRAAEATDLESLNRALDAREIVLARARELAPVLHSGTFPADLSDRIARVERADRELASVVARVSANTRAELDRIGATRVAVGGYAASMPRFRSLDRRR